MYNIEQLYVYTQICIHTHSYHVWGHEDSAPGNYYSSNNVQNCGCALGINVPAYKMPAVGLTLN